MSVLSWVMSNVALALVLALAAWVAQRRSWPAVAHVLWVLVLVKLVTPPLVSVPLGQAPAPTPCELGTCDCEHHPPAPADPWPWVLLAVWSAGAAPAAWLAWHRWAQFRRLVAHAGPAPAEWQALTARLATDRGIRCPPEVLAVPGRLPPMVVPGRWRPRLLLPAALLGQLDPAQRTALLLHELAHIKRGDHLVRLLEVAVGVAYWWLPVVGRIGRQLRACEESCCDEAVVSRRPDARRDYARLLLDVIDFAGPRPELVTAMSAADDLEKRLRAILDPAPATRPSRLAGLLVIGLACVALPCQLHPHLASRPTPLAATEGCEPAVGTAGLPGDDRPDALRKIGCCPS